MTDTGLDRGQMVLASRKGTVDIRQLSTILLRRRFLILGVSCIVMSVAGLLAFNAKSTYQSYMQILVNNIQDDADKELTGSKLKVIDYTPQMRLILSSKLIQKAVDSLLSEYPNITIEDIKGTKDKDGQKRPLFLRKVEEGTGERIFGQVFELSYQDSDPLKTQKVLQALQTVYEDYNIEQQKQRFAKALAFVNDRLPKLRQEVKQAEEKLEKFRKKYNLLDPQAQGKILSESLADIRKELQTTRAQLQDFQARQKNLEKELASSSQESQQNALLSSELSQSKRYQTLLSEIQKTEQALADERQRYTDETPVVQKLIQQRQSQVERLREEIGQILGTNKTDLIQPTLEGILERSRSAPAAAATAKPLQPSPRGRSLLSQDTKLPTDEPKWEALQQALAEKTPEAKNTKQPGEVNQKLKQEIIEVQTSVEGLRANEKSLAASEQQINSELSKYPSLISEYNRLLPEVETTRKKLEQLLVAQQSLGLKMMQTGFDLQVLEEPERGTYLGSNSLLFILGGVVLAPILGITAALIRELSHHVIYSPQELQKLTKLRLLATIPKLHPPHQPKKPLRLALNWRNSKTNSKTAENWEKKPLEAFTSLSCHETLDIAYQNIQILKSPLSFKSLMLTSAQSKEGKTTVALGLAMSAARMHRRVLLIDANLREPSLHNILDLSNEWGLSLLLVDEANSSFRNYVQPVHPSIDVLTAGFTLEDPVKLLTSGRMKELLELFEQNYDLVLIDAPAILGTVEAKILAAFCKNIVMAARMGKISETNFIQATEILSSLNLVGVIANEVSKSTQV